MNHLVLLLALGISCSVQVASPEAVQILKATGVTGGLIVHLGCGDGQLTAALYANDRYLVHGLDANTKNVVAARKHIASLGLEGKVTVEPWSGNSLPYVDNLVNLVVAEDLRGIPMAEVMRVLAPYGVAYIKNNGQWTKTVKPWPKDIDEWTHYLHDPSNNAVAHDQVVGPPRGLQWFAGPLYCRSHETDSSVSAMVSAAGRLFYILDKGPIGVADKRLPQNWAIIARDAFNGVPLWEVPFSQWGWPEWKKDDLGPADWTQISSNRLRTPTVLPRRLVADAQHVYVTLGFHAPITMLDAVTGKTLRTYAGTEDADEILNAGQKLIVCIRPQRKSEPKSISPKESAKQYAASKLAAQQRKLGQPVKVAKKNTNNLPKETITTDRIAAIDVHTGQILWQVSPGEVILLSLAIDGERVFFHDGKNVICLDLEKGTKCWQTSSQASGGRLFMSQDTLVACQGVVLTNSVNLEAFDAATGQKLWSAAKPRKGPGISNAPDLFLAGGLVWDGEDLQGRDPRTGEVKRTLDLEKLINPWHHYRCYRSKATDRYLIWPKQGAEFIDLVGQDNMRHDWFRGPCKYGILPCNGLVYAGPHQCSCFAGVKLDGFNVMRAKSSAPTTPAPIESRLQKGSAYASSIVGQASVPADLSAADWPSFRGNHLRSGSISGTVPAADLKTVWESPRFFGKISQAVVANGQLFVAAIDQHQIHCLDSISGKPLWTFTAGARIDSPPTIDRGLVLFGSADGWVYAVRATDGMLSWRFHAAPGDQRLVSMGQLESVWPLHGTTLVQNGVMYVVAGRSSYLDGGLFLSALDPITGKLLHEAHFEGPYPDVKTDDGNSRDMPGARTEVLVGDGQAVYLRQLKFDANLKQLGEWNKGAWAKDIVDGDCWRNSNYGDASKGMRIMSSSDLLDDAEFNRTCWRYSSQWLSIQGGGLSGQILVFDRTTTYAAQIYSLYVAQSLVYFPGENYVKLFAMKNDVEQPGQAGAKKRGIASLTKDGEWNVTIPIYVRAMALADKTLFVAGMPDAVDPKDPSAILEGRGGGILWAVSGTNGKKLASIKLDAPPTFDGLIAANGRLYMSLADGRLICLGAK